MPAIVVRHHGDRDVADLGLARQLGLLQVGHADHVHAPASVQFDSALRRKRRPFHAEVRAARASTSTPVGAQAWPTTSASCRADRIGEADVRHQAFAEKGGRAAARAVEKLVGDHEIERPVLLLERADRAERNDPLHAQLFDAVDVGAEVHLRRRDAMPAAVPGQKCHLFARQLAHDVIVRRRAPGRVEDSLLLRRQTRAWNTARCRR